ncbi:MAG: ABC transporter permease [Solirubrobacterales bacterium]
MSTDQAQTLAPRAGKRNPERRDHGRIALEALERGGLPLLGALLFLFFTINSTSGSVFTSHANITNILGNQAVTGLVALAMVVPLVAGYFDLSVSATTGVANIAIAAFIGTHGWPILPGILAVLLIGALIGAINGFLVAGLKLNGFVVTLGTYTLLGGLVQLYTKGQLITHGIPASFSNWGSQAWLGVPRPFYLLIAVAIVTWYVVTQVPFGRYLEAIGSNEPAARLVGINVNRTVWLSFVASGVIASVAGILATSRSGSGSPETGTAFLFPALAAVFLGATTIKPGRYNVWGTIIGVYFIAISVSGFTLLGAELWVQPVFNGVSLVVAVALSTLFARQRERRSRRSQLAEIEGDGEGGEAGLVARGRVTSE